MRTRYSARRHIGAAFVVATAAVAIPFISAAPAQAAPVTIHSEGSAVVESYPSDKEIHVDRFDDNGGLLELTEVKVIASVNGELEGSVQNLSASQPKVLTGSIEASITVNGIGVTDLAATGQNATVWNLAPGETQPLGLAGSDSSDTTITDPAVLDQFVGMGQIEYDVHSEVAVDINGPAPYKTTGVAGGEAKVRVEYTYNDTCVDNPTDPICVTGPDCVTDPVTVMPVANGDYAIPGGGTFTISNLDASSWTFDWSVVDATVESITVKGGDPVGSVITLVNGLLSGTGLHAPEDTNTGTYLEPTSVVVCAASSVTPPPCVNPFKVDPVNVGDYALPNGGIFTIVNKVDGPNGETFDWTSTAPVQWISVKGGPNSIPEEIFDYQPDGSFGDTFLHAPLNPNNGKWYGLSHLTICADPPPDPTCATDPTLCPPDPT